MTEQPQVMSELEQKARDIIKRIVSLNPEFNGETSEHGQPSDNICGRVRVGFKDLAAMRAMAAAPVPDGRVSEDEVTKALAELREMFPDAESVFVQACTGWSIDGYLSKGDDGYARIDARQFKGNTLAETMAKVRAFKAECVFTEGEEQNKN